MSFPKMIFCKKQGFNGLFSISSNLSTAESNKRRLFPKTQVVEAKVYKRKSVSKEVLRSECHPLETSITICFKNKFFGDKSLQSPFLT